MNETQLPNPLTNGAMERSAPSVTVAPPKAHQPGETLSADETSADPLPAGSTSVVKDRVEQPAADVVNASRGRMLAQMLIVLVVLVLLVNVPLSSRGSGLIHSVPDADATIIQDGVLLQGSGPDRYLVEDYQLRRFSSPKTFQYFDRRYSLHVQTVEDDLLSQFGQGPMIYRLASCKDMPEVYALENEQKRLVEADFALNSSHWDRVGLVGCGYLRNLPDGPPITEW